MLAPAPRAGAMSLVPVYSSPPMGRSE
jgi:hypothetical protein